MGTSFLPGRSSTRATRLAAVSSPMATCSSVAATQHPEPGRSGISLGLLFLRGLWQIHAAGASQLHTYKTDFAGGSSSCRVSLLQFGEMNLCRCTLFVGDSDF